MIQDADAVDEQAMPIRRGIAADLPRIVEIYNHYVAHSAATFDTTPTTVEARRGWFETFTESALGDGHAAPAASVPSARHQLFVATTSAGEVIGYAYSGAFRTRAAYDRSVETSIYLAPDALGRGLGMRLYGHLLSALEATDVHRAYGVITVPNDASIALHVRCGFVEVGRLTECGRKFDRWHDVAMLERAFPEGT